MSKNFYRYTWLAVLMVAASLACQTINGVTGQVNEVRGTAQTVITQAQGIATQGGQFLATAQAFATENPSLIQTAQAFATQEGPALAATAQALATDNPGVLQTLQAVVTHGLTSQDGPDDIPALPDDQTTNRQSSPDFLTYSTSVAFAEVVSFYREQMAANGWQLDEANSFENANVSIQQYRQGSRAAVLTISQNPGDESTLVAVVVTGE